MADSREKILFHTPWTNGKQFNPGKKALGKESPTERRFSSITHCLRVAGRKPTISMASWSLSKSCFRSSPSTVKQSYKKQSLAVISLYIHGELSGLMANYCELTDVHSALECHHTYRKKRLGIDLWSLLCNWTERARLPEGVKISGP